MNDDLQEIYAISKRLQNWFAGAASSAEQKGDVRVARNHRECQQIATDIATMTGEALGMEGVAA